MSENVNGKVEKPPVTERKDFYRTPLFFMIIASLAVGTFYFLYYASIPNDKEISRLLFILKTLFPVYIFMFMAFLNRKKKRTEKLNIIVASATVVLTAFTYLFIRTSTVEWNFIPQVNQAIILSVLHYIVAYWGIFGLFYVADGFNDTEKRISYLNFSVKMVIAMMIVGFIGFVLSGLVSIPFGILDESSSFFRNILIFTGSAVPLISLYFAEYKKYHPKRERPERKIRLSKQVSLIIIGFIAFTLFIYIITILRLIVVGSLSDLIQGRILNRSFLSFMNAVLLVTLLIVIRLLIKRDEAKEFSAHDAVVFGLIGSSVILDLIGILGIVFRFAEYGFTPNRFVVIVFNFAILGHLIGILLKYIGFFRDKNTNRQINGFSMKYISIYVIYAVVVSISLSYYANRFSTKIFAEVTDDFNENIESVETVEALSLDFEGVDEILKEGRDNIMETELPGSLLMISARENYFYDETNASKLYLEFKLVDTNKSLSEDLYFAYLYNPVEFKYFKNKMSLERDGWRFVMMNPREYESLYRKILFPVTNDNE